MLYLVFWERKRTHEFFITIIWSNDKLITCFQFYWRKKTIKTMNIFMQTICCVHKCLVISSIGKYLTTIWAWHQLENELFSHYFVKWYCQSLSLFKHVLIQLRSARKKWKKRCLNLGAQDIHSILLLFGKSFNCTYFLRKTFFIVFFFSRSFTGAKLTFDFHCDN